MTAQINVNSWSYLIQLGLMQRLLMVPPFNTAATFARSNYRPIRPEQIPFFGCYHVHEEMGPDGDANQAEPRFTASLTLGFSYIIQNNDPDAAQDMLDAAHWSLMKYLHNPMWHRFVYDPTVDPVEIESVTGGTHSRHYGTLGGNANAMPIAEGRTELSFVHRFGFEPTVTDLFETMHVTVVYPWPEDPARQPIIAEWVLPQN